MRFQDNVVVVTGGGSGIGAATARVPSGRRNRRLLRSQRRTRRGIRRGTGEVQDLVQNVVAPFGRLDILVNNAGIGSLATTADIILKDWHRVIDTDLNGVFYGRRAALPVMRAQGAVRSSIPRPHRDWSGTMALRPTMPQKAPWSTLRVRQPRTMPPMGSASTQRAPAL
jgi:NAD(P)-dependent dehydrogenase (short-subunit alcohol dehydrogenase family)